MEESKSIKPGPPQNESGSDKEATSKETVADLEDDEKSSAGTQGEREAGVQSPDGSFDEKRETDDAGPM
jgi:hypothetical protein